MEWRRRGSKARALLEEAAGASGFEEAAGADSTSLCQVEEKGFGDLMYERFKDVGLTEDEVRRFNGGIARFNSCWEMSLPDFESDEYEESPSK